MNNYESWPKLILVSNKIKTSNPTLAIKRIHFSVQLSYFQGYVESLYKGFLFFISLIGLSNNEYLSTYRHPYHLPIINLFSWKMRCFTALKAKKILMQFCVLIFLLEKIFFINYWGEKRVSRKHVSWWLSHSVVFIFFWSCL